MQSCKFKITKFGEDKPIRWTESDPLKVSKSQKQIMASWILPKNERLGIFQYIKLPLRNPGQHIFFSRFSDLYWLD